MDRILIVHVYRKGRLARSAAFGMSLGALLTALGCSDPADRFIRMMDKTPPEKQLPNWAETRRMMLRPAPKVGDAAPDFTLSTADGQTQIVRSQFAAGRPMVLVFGSFT